MDPDVGGRRSRRSSASGGRCCAGSRPTCRIASSCRCRRIRPTRRIRSRFARRSPTASSSRATTRRSSRISRATTASTRDLPLDWAIDRDGEYRGTFTPDQPGVYTVRVDASIPNGGVGRRHDATCASPISTPSTSTPRCARRCSSAWRARRAAGSTRRRRRARWPKTSR